MARLALGNRRANKESYEIACNKNHETVTKAT